MGIPGFFGSWLNRHAAEVNENTLPDDISSLSIDLNGFFYQAKEIVVPSIKASNPRVAKALEAVDLKEITTKIKEVTAVLLFDVITKIQATDCLILAVDGVAPLAKIKQQKARREQAARDRDPYDPILAGTFSPGTEFMIEMDKFLTLFIAKYQNHSKFPRKIIYSSHLTPGEGEHKIFEYFRKGTVGFEGNHVVYGLDADLALLSLISPVNNIYLARGTRDRYRRDKSVNVVTVGNINNIVNIERLKDHIQANIPVDDFVLLMSLFGNDFLPAMPALEQMDTSIENVIELYDELNLPLTEEGDVNWSNLSRFFNMLADKESEYLTVNSTKAIAHPSPYLKAAIKYEESQSELKQKIKKPFFHYDIFVKLWYNNSLGPKGDKVFVDNLLDIINKHQSEQIIDKLVTLDESLIYRISHNYLQMLAWVYLYYKQGYNTINRDLLYHWHYTPLLDDIDIYLQDKPNISGYRHIPNNNDFTVLHQLIAILPLQSIDLLPIELRSLMLHDSSIRDYFPHNFTIDLSGKNNDHSGVILVPIVNKKRIIDAVGSIPFTLERVMRWIPPEDLILERSAEDEESIKAARLTQQQKIRKERNYSPRDKSTGYRGRGRGFRESGTTSTDTGFRGSATGAITTPRSFRGSSTGTINKPRSFRGRGTDFRNRGKSNEEPKIVSIKYKPKNTNVETSTPYVFTPPGL